MKTRFLLILFFSNIETHNKKRQFPSLLELQHFQEVFRSKYFLRLRKSQETIHKCKENQQVKKNIFHIFNF